MNQGTTEGAGLLPEMAGLDEGAPLFVQIAERLAEDIADGSLAEGERVPSTNELAAFYRINPATAAKGISMLTDDGLVEKRRGIGMFVAGGGRRRALGRAGEWRRSVASECSGRPAPASGCSTSGASGSPNALWSH